MDAVLVTPGVSFIFLCLFQAQIIACLADALLVLKKGEHLKCLKELFLACFKDGNSKKRVGIMIDADIIKCYEVL